MKLLIGAVLGCIVFYFANAFIQNDIAWFGTLYNDAYTDGIERFMTLVLFIVFGVGGAWVADTE